MQSNLIIITSEFQLQRISLFYINSLTQILCLLQQHVLNNEKVMAVQEDAKRAPELARCPLSSSKLQSDASGGDAASRPDQPATSLMPINWNPGNSNLQPDTRWWLQLQPNHKDFTYEGLNASEAGIEQLRDGEVNPTSKFQQALLPCVDDDVGLKKNSCSSLEPNWRVSAPCLKHDSDARVQELWDVNEQTPQPLKPKVCLGEYGYWNDKFMDSKKTVDGLISDGPEKASLHLEMHLMGGDWTKRWWWTADKDELATLVAIKSTQQIENCDLPQPTPMHFWKGPFAYLENFDHNPILSASLDQKIRSGLCKLSDCAHTGPTSGSMDGRHQLSDEVGRLFYHSKRFCSDTNGSGDAIKGPVQTGCMSKTNPSKEAQLMEALRHSQTRAREAERAAQQAYVEKEHIITLFVRQAYHLFACKQWLQVLQLETLLQPKAKDRRNTLTPVFPWMLSKKVKRLRKGAYKVMQRRVGQRKYNVGMYAVAIVVRMSLVGAGLLLGWTMGWLLTAF